ncbi:MAG TPA: hypothetical protein VJK48_06755 [Chlamydiales bacterium]|nr:hypothetical protein [Chlamydiales bacterium]
MGQLYQSPETVRFLLEKAMPEYSWFTNQGRVHQDRTSCRYLVRRSCKRLSSPNKIQEMGADAYAASFSGGSDGYRYSSFSRCWGLRPGWLERQQQLR